MGAIEPIYIAGEWRRGGGEVYASHYPADGSVTAELAAASLEDVNAAIEAAHVAWQKPDWRDIKPHARAAILYRIGALIRERSEALALLLLEQAQLLEGAALDDPAGFITRINGLLTAA